MVSTNTTTTRPSLAEQRAATVERRVVRGLLGARVALFTAEAAGWHSPPDGAVEGLTRVGGGALDALQHLAGVPRCQSCGEAYGHHAAGSGCHLAGYLREAVERANPVVAVPAAWVVQHGPSRHPYGPEGPYLACAPDPVQRHAPTPRTGLVVRFADLDALPVDTLVWPVVLPAGTDGKPAGLESLYGDPQAVTARLSRQPLRTTPWRNA